ncbi:phospholipase D-like domain-containing protein [Lysobacter auxotrophicus]|uniref:phospholipase D n=1 Tax=Lysobacter auxotrophicus TaxID=2992573 RepID=A0ABM8D9F3_9GAMM|nr:phospholipase D-like domain-containing protein [Lysobacter auxotrophicus]BDU15183.1 phospholipase D-like domain-containing protein [Lysobacter auxotrophicus]
MDFTQLDSALRDSAVDMKLDERERFELRELGARIDADRIRYLRNRAFDMAQELVATPSGDAGAVLRWLEQVVRTLDLSSLPAAAGTTAFFSPGDSCLNKLRELCRGARERIDACVFTIADDRLSDELAAAHKRGIAVRIISDNDKRFDDGSDIARLAREGIEVRLDDSPFHMHHKFAMFDGKVVANGSFNWTRTASTSNHENLVVSRDTYLVRCFGGQFEQMWSKFPTLSP